MDHETRIKRQNRRHLDDSVRGFSAILVNAAAEYDPHALVSVFTL